MQPFNSDSRGDGSAGGGSTAGSGDGFNRNAYNVCMVAEPGLRVGPSQGARGSGDPPATFASLSTSTSRASTPHLDLQCMNLQCSDTPSRVEDKATQVETRLIQESLEHRIAELEVRLNAVHEHHRLVQECLQEKVSALESQLQAVSKQTNSSEVYEFK